MMLSSPVLTTPWRAALGHPRQRLLQAFCGSVELFWQKLQLDSGQKDLRFLAENPDEDIPLGVMHKLLDAMKLSPGTLHGTHDILGKKLLDNSRPIPGFFEKGDEAVARRLDKILRQVPPRADSADKLSRMLPYLDEQAAGEILSGARPMPLAALMLVAEFCKINDVNAMTLVRNLVTPPSFMPEMRLKDPRPVTDLLAPLEKAVKLTSSGLGINNRSKPSGASGGDDDEVEDDDESAEADKPLPTLNPFHPLPLLDDYLRKEMRRHPRATLMKVLRNALPPLSGPAFLCKVCAGRLVGLTADNHYAAALQGDRVVGADFVQALAQLSKKRIEQVFREAAITLPGFILDELEDAFGKEK